MTRPIPKVINLAEFREFDGDSGVGPHIARLPRKHIAPARYVRARRALWAGVIIASVALGMMLAASAFARATHDTAGMICPAPC